MSSNIYSQENPFGIIYLTTNLVNNKRYIGQTSKEKYFLNEKDYLGSGKIIKKAIKKYGINSFQRETLDIALSQDELNDLEIYYIAKYNAVESDDFYNIQHGGHFQPPYNHTDEHKQRLAETLKGENNPFYGKKHTEESKQKMSEAKKGTVASEESKKKMSLASKGKPKSAEHCRNLSLGQMGRIQTPETRQKISETNTGKKLSEETKKKMSESSKGFTHTEETKNKIREANTGKPLTPEHCEKISKGKKGKKLSVDHKEKIKQGNLNRVAKECPHCKRMVKSKNYHFDNCRENINNK